MIGRRFTSGGIERLARVGAALLVFGMLAGTAPASTEPLRGEPHVAGTIVLLGEDFALPEDAARALLASARSGERVWISSAAATDASAVDPLMTTGKVPGQPAKPLVIDAWQPRAGDEAGLCERTRRAGCVVLTGGAYLDWWALFTPREKRSGLCAALVEAHRSGALVIASGAAASFLGDWAIVDRAALNRLRRNPRDPSLHTLVRGLGLVPDTIIDASGAPQGGLFRLLTLSARGPSQRALYLDGAVAWIISQDDQPSTVIRGSGAVLVFDFHAARWQDRTLRGGRLSLLGDGDRWNERERTVSTATRGLDPGAPEVRVAPSIVSSNAAPGIDAAAIRRVLAAEFSASRRTDAVLSQPHFELSMRTDAATAFGQSALEKPAARARIAFELFWDGPSGS